MAKQQLVTPETVEDLVGVLREVAPEYDWDEVAAVAGGFEELGLAERVGAVRGALMRTLPERFDEMAAMIGRALELPRFAGWMIWPVSEAVAQRAVEGERADVELGLSSMADLTGRLTAEFALRYFLLADAPATVSAAMRWTGSSDPAVRRLATEGTRPRLPWAKRVPLLLTEPETTLPILFALRADPDEVVRRSVGNHLNDISRDHPDLAVRCAEEWLRDPADTTPAVVRRGLRTLVKRGDPRALSLLGFGDAESLTVTGPVLAEDRLRIGDDLEFTGTIRHDGEEPVRVAIDFVVHFLKANGTTSPRVFKLGTRSLDPGQTIPVSHGYPLRNRTTRRHYAGAHGLELQVNGRRFGWAPFTLTLETSS